MGDDYNRYPETSVYVADKLKYRRCRFGVKRACRLVAEKHLRVCCKSAGYRDPLLLTAGKLGGICLCLVGKPDKLKQILCALFCLGAFYTGKLKRKADVCKAVSLHKEIEALKYHCDVTPCPAQLRRRELCHVGAVDKHLPGGRALKHIYAPHKRAFSGTAHADYAVNVAVVNCQADVFQRIDGVVGAGKALRQIPYFNHFCSVSFAENLSRYIKRPGGAKNTSG